MKKYIAAALLSITPVLVFAASHGGSGMGWFGTTVVSSLIHGLIYGVIFKLFHAMGLVPSIIVALIALGGAYLYYQKSNNRR